MNCVDFRPRAAPRKQKFPFRPEAGPRSWLLAPSGSRERETTNCIALIQPETRSLRRLELDLRPRFLAAGEGSVWVFNEGRGTVQRIDGKDSKLLATIETEAVGKGSITVGGGFVWVNTRLLPIIQIDPRTNSVRRKFNLVEMAEYSTIAYAGGSLWVSGSSVRRIKIPE